MGLIEIIMLGVGLAMDATAVSMSDGMNNRKIAFPKALMIGLTFGVFQGLMPLLGYLFGTLFSDLIMAIDHWIALILLGYLGGKMLYDGLKKDDAEEDKTELTFKGLMVQGIATSIDALAIGISLATLNVEIVPSVLSIGIITAILSVIGVYVGKKFGDLLNNKAAILGGLILIAIGLKIFIEHMFF
ncbi:MAG: manganese efflux pump [Bacilli bacterium]|nr:manganese efflux pump [Bacilli bacterium]